MATTTAVAATPSTTFIIVALLLGCLHLPARACAWRERCGASRAPMPSIRVHPSSSSSSSLSTSTSTSSSSLLQRVSDHHRHRRHHCNRNNTAQPHPPPLPFIPDIVHFIFGLREDHVDDFGLVQFLCILSAHTRLPPATRLMLHVHRAPSPAANRWFNRTVHLPRVRVMPIRAVRDIEGRRIRHAAHAADLLRLQVLARYGGVYLDTDVLVLRALVDERARRRGRCVFGMAREGMREEEEERGRAHTLPPPSSSSSRPPRRETRRKRHIGLCNAVMWSTRHAAFLRRWLLEYRHYRPRHWNYHSVQLPARLARRWRAQICVLPQRAYFALSWARADLHQLYGAFDGRAPPAGARALHLWYQAAVRSGYALHRMRLADVRRGRGLFHRVARRLLDDAARRNGGVSVLA